MSAQIGGSTLSEWKQWLKTELTPPYSEAASNDQVRHVLHAFLELVNIADAAPELLEALKLLHDNTADYVRINNLGDPYQNQDMRMARDAIAKAEAKS